MKGNVNRARVRLRVIEYLETHSCVDCGEDDYVVLEFDHREDSVKHTEVATMVGDGVGWAKVEAEIAKCDVRCANCHRRRTAEQWGHYKRALSLREQARSPNSTTSPSWC